ncbi:MAG: exodeoxyribonuclease VII small subunit [Planctomycetaceae bacterium]|nr:exodeoxyribonuclease VII small subunit [Planctomycetaceae bacterium]
MAKKKTKAKDESSDLNFEDAIGEIQEIVRQLEEGELGLDQSLEKFEDGVRLIRSCHATLEHAEQKIKVLTDVDEEGNPILADFDASSTIDANKKSAGRRKKKSATDDEKDSASDGSSLF